MPTEDELRDALHSTPSTSDPIDTDAVLRAARRRRTPRVVAFGSAAALATAGILIVGVNLTGLFGPASMSARDSSAGMNSDTGPDGVAAPESAQYPLLDEVVNRCGEPVSNPAPSRRGLALSVSFPTALPVGTHTVEGSVTLTNTGRERVSGSTAAAPTITLSSDGVTVWHSNGAMIATAVLVDLAPGQSMEYPASFTPVRCSPEDEFGDAFRSDLPALEPGRYEVSAILALVPDASATEASELVGGDPIPITLH